MAEREPDAVMLDRRPEHDAPRLHQSDAPWPAELADVVAHPAPFVCGLTVSADQLSRSIPHVSNIEYVRWLDRAAELHALAVGASWRDLYAQGRMWFVARHEIDYQAEVWESDELLIATWVREFRRVKSWRDSVIARPSDGTIVCCAATLWVLVDLVTRRPVRIAPDLAARFTPLRTPPGEPPIDR